MRIRAKSFEAWMLYHFNKEELKDIAEHGVDGGFHGLTHYCDTVSLYDKFHHEIWRCLWDDFRDYGHDTVYEFMATWNKAHAPANDMQFKNHLVWYMAETIARRITDEAMTA